MADYRWRAESRASSGVQALGRILFGYGNSGDSQEEGFYLNKALFSNALGPLLIQNPRFALDLLKAALQHAFTREQGRPANAEEAEALQQQLQLPALTWEEEALRLKLDFISGKKNHLSNCDNRLLKDYSPKGRL